MRSQCQLRAAAIFLEAVAPLDPVITKQAPTLPSPQLLSFPSLPSPILLAAPKPPQEHKSCPSTTQDVGSKLTGCLEQFW